MAILTSRWLIVLLSPNPLDFSRAQSLWFLSVWYAQVVVYMNMPRCSVSRGQGTDGTVQVPQLAINGSLSHLLTCFNNISRGDVDSNCK